MPFDVLTLAQARSIARDYVAGKLPGAALAPPNSRLRVLSDSNAALAQLNLLFLQWLSQQFLPDTAETEWLDRHANIWVGGRKSATFASGSVSFTGTAGKVVPSGTIGNLAAGGVQYQMTQNIVLGSTPTIAPAVALTPGVIANVAPGNTLSIAQAISGVDASATIVGMAGGTDAETDDELRARVLFRIQNPPMGGDAADYELWARSYPGVTRAWVSPLEQGVGTVTLRVMMDDLRAGSGGLPNQDDLDGLAAYIGARRPVATKDLFIVAPVFESVNFTVRNLDPDDSDIRAAIEANVASMIASRGAPAHSVNGVGQPAATIFAVWVSAAIAQTAGVISFDLSMADHVMPNPGNLATLGSITYVP